jgi:two-component system sensor histidine kinase KdpD
MAAVGHSPWSAVYVETPASLRLAAADRRRVAENLRVAQQLGAETSTILGESAAEEMLRYARSHNVTRIVVGKPTHPRWRDLLARSFLEEMVRSSEGIDVYVISGDAAEVAGPRQEPAPAPPIRIEAYAASALVVTLTTAISWFAFGRDRLADVVMIYLLGIIVVAMRFGYGPSIAATISSVLLVDFFFVPPYFSFAVSDFQHIVTFGVMFVVAVVISGLTQRIRDHARAAAVREQRTASLYALTRELAGTRATAQLAAVAVRHLHDVFEAKVALFLVSDGEKLASLASGDHTFAPDEKERGVLEWAWSHDRPAGMSTDTLPSAAALYVPLHEARGRIGVLGVSPSDRERFVDPEQRALLDVFASQIASALERARLAEATQKAHLQVEAERLRSALLSSISHDLRTPLAVITGAASTLVEPTPTLTNEARRDLTETIYEEAARLNRLVHNLLEMTKIVSGAIKVAKEWQPLEEVIGAVLSRTESALLSHSVEVKLPPDLPLVPIDAVLIEQVLINLLENAAKYTPKGSHITLSATHEAGERTVTVEVADDGPGIPHDLEDKIFEKFYRLPREREGSGAGLGLAICRGIVAAHGGRIWASNGPRGGAVFRFTIPIEGTPPTLVAEDAK